MTIIDYLILLLNYLIVVLLIYDAENIWIQYLETLSLYCGF